MYRKTAVALALVLGTMAVGPAFASVKIPVFTGSSLVTIKNPGGPVMINPQPLPPGGASRGFFSPGSKVMLNPQPLPPKAIGTFSR
jgi:hypothetical protein